MQPCYRNENTQYFSCEEEKKSSPFVFSVKSEGNYCLFYRLEGKTYELIVKRFDALNQLRLIDTSNRGQALSALKRFGEFNGAKVLTDLTFVSVMATKDDNGMKKYSVVIVEEGEVSAISRWDFGLIDEAANGAAWFAKKMSFPYNPYLLIISNRIENISHFNIRYL